MRATVVKLVAFTAACLAFTLYLALTIGNARLADIVPFVDDGTYDLTARFDDVTGLLPNDDVKVAGVRVGKVTSIRVDRGRAVVRFRVRDGVRLPADSEAAVRWRNLLGQRYVYLYPGEGSTVLPDGGAIGRTRAVVDLGELFNRLGPIVQRIDPADVNRFLVAVSGALDGNEAELRRAIDDLALVATSLAARDETIGSLVENLDTVAGTLASRDAQIRTVLDNLLTVTQTFAENTDVLERAAVEIGTFGEDLATLLAGNRDELDGIIDDLVTLVRTVEGRLPSLDTALTNLDETGGALFRASRYGEFLNQTIPCGRLFQPVVVSSACNPALSGDQRPASTTRGATAVARLLPGGEALAEGGPGR